jgi:hypothetical protein
MTERRQSDGRQADGRQTGVPDVTTLRRSQAPGAARPDPGLFDPTAVPSRQVDCGNFDIRILRDGTWLYRGSPIDRQPLVKLFASVLRRDSAGAYWLVTPAERGRITVEDAPFTAVELSQTGEGREQVLRFRTNVDDTVSAGESHPIRVDNDDVTGEPNPYILVRTGLEARLSRAVFYQLVDLGGEEQVGDQTLFGVWSNGTFLPLGRISDPP